MFNTHSDTQTKNSDFWWIFFRNWYFLTANRNFWTLEILSAIFAKIFRKSQLNFRYFIWMCNFWMKFPKFWAWVSPIRGFFGQRRLVDWISYPYSHILTKWINWKKVEKMRKKEFHVFLFIWSCSFHLAHILFVHFRLKMGLNWLSGMFRIWLNRCAYICLS